ncbi:MAG TPA: hypothetical protein VGK16_07590 [Candidatus Limnocylindrales bacterium]|jgi:hypothetical protein
MSTRRDPDDILATWLEEGPTRLPHTARRAIVVDARTTRQSRRAWRAPWRFTDMNPAARIALAIMAAAFVVGGTVFALGRSAQVAAPTTPSAPTTAPAPSSGPASPDATPCVASTLGASSALTDPACSFESDQLTPRVSFSGAPGLRRISENARHLELGVTTTGSSAATGQVVVIALVDAARTPCDPKWADAPVLDTVPWRPSTAAGGPAAFMDILATTPVPMDTPVPVTIDGHAGLETVLRPVAGDLAECGGFVAFADILTSRAGIGEGIVMRLAAVDVDGTTVLVERAADAAAFDAASDALESVAGTIRFP